VRWGILGTGGIARQFVADLQLTGHEVTAVGSRAAVAAARFAADYGIARAHASYEDLVADDAVDIVYVATPHSRHHADALLALAAGKHALVEKAFTINAAEAQELVDLAAARGLVVLEAMWTRWLPHMVAVRSLISEGGIGEVRAVLADHTQKLPEDPAHRINALAFAADMLGTPSSIDATATFKATGADAETAMIFRYDGGQTAVLYTASTAAGPNRATVIGTEGRIEIDAVWYTPTSFRHYDATGALRATFDGSVPGRGMQFQADEAERLIATSATSEILSPAESVSIMATMDSVRQIIGLRYPGE
jgi:predicted dehydrogenase